MNLSSVITVTLGIIIGSAIGIAGFSGAIDLSLFTAANETDAAKTSGNDASGRSESEPKNIREQIFDKAEAYLKKHPSDRHRALIYGGALVEEGEYERAERFYLSRLEKRPKDSDFIYGLGWAYEQSQQWAKAVKAYEMACEANVKNVTASNNLAWVLATSPDDSVRDGKRAVRFARRAMQVAPSIATFADTLAAAYAETGDFENAIKYQHIVLKSKSTNELRQRLELYRQGKPFRSQ